MKNKNLFKSKNPLRFFIKSKTNNGEFSKQYFTILTGENAKPALDIRKLVLTDDFYLYRNYRILKEYKDKRLYEDDFVIKLKTLNIVIDTLNKIKWISKKY